MKSKEVFAVENTTGTFRDPLQKETGKPFTDLKLTSSKIGGIFVVRLRGAILFGKESAALRALVKDLLSKARQIVLDLTDVTRIDSAGLGTLVGLFVSARAVGTVIKLSNPGNHANEILRITRLAAVFEIFETTEEAIASFKLSATTA
jgi:anti-sigma B factor antagonist